WTAAKPPEQLLCTVRDEQQPRRYSDQRKSDWRTARVNVTHWCDERLWLGAYVLSGTHRIIPPIFIDTILYGIIRIVNGRCTAFPRPGRQNSQRVGKSILQRKGLPALRLKQ